MGKTLTKLAVAFAAAENAETKPAILVFAGFIFYARLYSARR
jgi:hypothetical protein